MAVFEINPTLVYSLLAVLPPAAVFFTAYGRYDGAFHDNVVFLYFMGGILMGFLLGFLTIAALSSGIAPLIVVALLSLLYPISLTVGINRRKWQGERHAVFNGGAFGIGSALMLGFTFLYVLYGRGDITLLNVVQALLFVAGITGVFFGLGLMSGDAVRRRKPLPNALIGTGVVLVPVILMVEFVALRAWLWLVLLLLYGLIFAVAAERRLLIEGVSDEARRARRRKRRAVQE